MKKRVILLIFLAILFSLNVYAAYPYGQKFDTARVLRPFYEVTRPFTETQDISEDFEDLTALPDLIITDIHIPEELPRYTIITDLSLEIKNIGAKKAQGAIQVEIEIDEPNKRNCRQRFYASGGFGSSDPRQTSHTRLWRFAVVPPDHTQTIYLSIPFGVSTSLVQACDRQPVANDFAIKATVNPRGGGPTVSRTPRGRILESDESNNVFVKKIKLSDNPSEQSVDIRLVQGTNAFTLPVIVEDLTANEFVRRTGCDLMYLPEESVISGYGDKTLNLEFLSKLGPEELLKPGVAYFANCFYPTNLRVTGADPGAFDKRLSANALNIIPIRVGMRGLRFYDLYRGCSKAYGTNVQTEFYSYVSGTRTANGKLQPESTPTYTQVMPGLLYYMMCGSTYGGTWDPENHITGEFVGVSHPSRPNLKPYRAQDIQGSTAIGSGYRYASRVVGGTRLHTYKFSSSYYRNN